MYQNESIIESTLNIINTQSSDVGAYTCEAENIIGSGVNFWSLDSKWYVASLYLCIELYTNIMCMYNYSFKFYTIKTSINRFSLFPETVLNYLHLLYIHQHKDHRRKVFQVGGAQSLVTGMVCVKHTRHA